jgi:hypothetical protein
MQYTLVPMIGDVRPCSCKFKEQEADHQTVRGWMYGHKLDVSTVAREILMQRNRRLIDHWWRYILIVQYISPDSCVSLFPPNYNYRLPNNVKYSFLISALLVRSCTNRLRGSQDDAISDQGFKIWWNLTGSKLAIWSGFRWIRLNSLTIWYFFSSCGFLKPANPLHVGIDLVLNMQSC